MTKEFTFWRFVSQVGWARSGTWGSVDADGWQHARLVSVEVVSFENKTAIKLFLGPILLVAGYAA